MASLSSLLRRQLPPLVSRFTGLSKRALTPPLLVPLRRFRGSAWSRAGETGPGKGAPWNRTRVPEQQGPLTDLDKADALMLRKSHETGFLSWFRNGLLSTGIGVIAFVQSDVGREAGYAFFILGGVCVAFGGGAYVFSLLALRRLMLLSLPALLLQGAAVSGAALLWLCAVSLYIGRLEVEIIHDEDEEEDGGEGEEGEEGGADHRGKDCPECRERRENPSQDYGGGAGRDHGGGAGRDHGGGAGRDHGGVSRFQGRDK